MQPRNGILVAGLGIVLVLTGCNRAGEQVLIYGTCFVMIFGSIGVLLVANRKMMGHYRAYAGRFGLEVRAHKEFGLYKYPRVEGTHNGRRIQVHSGGRLSGFDGRLVHRVSTKLSIALSPVVRFGLARKLTLGRAGKLLAESHIDDDAFSECFEVDPPEAAASVLALLSQPVRRALLEHADGIVLVDETGLSFSIRQTMMTNAREQKRFEALTEALIELADAVDDLAARGQASWRLDPSHRGDGA